MDELVVTHPIQLGRRANAHNPQRAILPLALLAARVSKLQPALHRLFGGAVQLRFGEEITASAFKYLFSFRAAFGSAFYTRHSILLFAFSVLAAGGNDHSPS